MSARTTATRWRSPPESSPGRWDRALAQADPLQEASCPFAGAVARRGLRTGERRDQDVLQDRALRQEVVRLEDEADLPVPHRGELLIVQGAQILPVESDRPAGGPVERADDVQQGALARTGGADDGEGFAPRDFERHIVEHSQSASLAGES